MYHDNYKYYKMARDTAWKTLIKCNISSLPVNLSTIIKQFNIYAVPYSSGYVPDNNEEDGFSLYKANTTFIFYNDSKHIHRVRFTLAHELGHCLLGHLKFGKTYNKNSELDFESIDVFEMQANVFARDLLMPATVLNSLNVKSPNDISRLCNVSMQSAELRYTRLLELKKRNMFNKHPLERRVYNNFTNYINEM